MYLKNCGSDKEVILNFKYLSKDFVSSFFGKTKKMKSMKIELNELLKKFNIPSNFNNFKGKFKKNLGAKNNTVLTTFWRNKIGTNENGQNIPNCK